MHEPITYDEIIKRPYKGCTLSSHSIKELYEILEEVKSSKHMITLEFAVERLIEEKKRAHNDRRTKAI